MKAGDKIYCIKEYSNLYIKNNYYTINSIICDDIILDCNIDDQLNNYDFIIYISTENTLMSTIVHSCTALGFHTIKNRSVMFSDFFISIKMNRKLKLEKINESW